MSELATALHTVEQAEERLRAAGLTGSRAIEVLVAALQRSAGLPTEVSPAHTALLDGLELHSTLDVVGAAWQRWFPGMYRARFGQFFTPRPVARLLLAGLGTVETQVVLDPMCGAGGLLAEAADCGAHPVGIEIDPRLAQLAEARLALCGARAAVRCGDAFCLEQAPVDIVVANPPFSLPSPEGSSEHRFLRRLSTWLRPGGRAALVLPWSLWRDRRGVVSRQQLLRQFRVDAVCALPEGVFRAHGGAGGRAVLVWLTRGGTPSGHQVRYAEVRDPGWDVASEQLRTTGSTELEQLAAGHGWRVLDSGELWPRGTPLPVPGRALRELVSGTASKRRPAAAPSRCYELVELADLDRTTGEIGVLRQRLGAQIPQHKLCLEPGDVLVSRLRPALRRVGVVPAHVGPELAGSTEWIALRGVRLPWLVAHLLRTEAWRSSLGPTEGQLRPRLRQEQVLGSSIPWPGQRRAERADQLLTRLHEKRRALLEQIGAVEAALENWSAGQTDLLALDAALDAASIAVESAEKPRD